MSQLLLVDYFETFEGVINEGIMCMAMPCFKDGEPAYYVPDGWQQDLDLKNIPYTEIDESEIVLPGPEH